MPGQPVPSFSTNVSNCYDNIVAGNVAVAGTVSSMVCLTFPEFSNITVLRHSTVADSSSHRWAHASSRACGCNPHHRGRLTSPARCFSVPSAHQRHCMHPALQNASADYQPLMACCSKFRPCDLANLPARSCSQSTC